MKLSASSVSKIVRPWGFDGFYLPPWCPWGMTWNRMHQPWGWGMGRAWGMGPGMTTFYRPWGFWRRRWASQLLLIETWLKFFQLAPIHFIHHRVPSKTSRCQKNAGEVVLRYAWVRIVGRFALHVTVSCHCLTNRFFLMIVQAEQNSYLNRLCEKQQETISTHIGEFDCVEYVTGHNACSDKNGSWLISSNEIWTWMLRTRWK